MQKHPMTEVIKPLGLLIMYAFSKIYAFGRVNLGHVSAMEAESQFHGLASFP